MIVKHHWKLDEDGNIDEYAWDQGFHSGVVCVDCGTAVCTNCHPDYMDLDDCPGAPKKIAYTRADRMRGMTDAELVKEILSIADTFFNRPETEDKSTARLLYNDIVAKHILEYLQEDEPNM
jgi:hypothetical protein